MLRKCHTRSSSAHTTAELHIMNYTASPPDCTLLKMWTSMWGVHTVYVSCLVLFQVWQKTVGRLFILVEASCEFLQKSKWFFKKWFQSTQLEVFSFNLCHLRKSVTHSLSTFFVLRLFTVECTCTGWILESAVRQHLQCLLISWENAVHIKKVAHHILLLP